MSGARPPPTSRKNQCHGSGFQGSPVEPSTRTVRISTRVAGFPDWVLDYVIVHELAHLDHPGHDQAFWNVVARYPRTERAIGFLIAKSGDADL